jgi:cytidylate kinase
MKPIKPVTITIDWPAGSGKWTTAMRLAEKLGYKYFDSGALYRALGVYLSEKGENVLNIDSELTDIHLDFSPENHVRVNGEDYESKIRTVEASTFASQLSSQKYPREIVISSGQKIIQADNYVLEGRDTGTVWFPSAQVKIYLTADATVRAHRRWMELQAKWEDVSEEEVLKKICERDDRDMTRADGPLRKPEWAYEIDTTYLTIDEQVERIYEIVQEKLQIMN